MSPCPPGCAGAVGTAEAGACFSQNRSHRYALWRIWDANVAPLAGVFLNPSVANEVSLDNTLIRVKRRAEQNGYGGIIIANAFAIVSTDPDLLYEDPYGAIGSANNDHLFHLAEIAGAVVLGWGGDIEAKALRFRARQLREIFREGALCWGTTKGGSPRHPLYLGYQVSLQPYSW